MRQGCGPLAMVNFALIFAAAEQSEQPASLQSHFTLMVEEFQVPA